MTIAQSTTTKFSPVAIEGQKFPNQIEAVTNKIVDEAGGISPGRAVTRGTDPARDVSLPTAGTVTADLLGFTLLSSTEKENLFSGNTATTVEDFLDDEPVLVVERGRVAVLPEDAVTAGDPVFVRIDTGAGGSTLGRVRSDADTATAVEFTGWVYESSTTAGDELVTIVRLS